MAEQDFAQQLLVSVFSTLAEVEVVHLPQVVLAVYQV
jgi:hypothetical protein